MPLADDTKLCPYCGQEIKAIAIKCRFCSEFLDEEEPLPYGEDASGEQAVRWLIPIGRSGWAVASGYLGLLACFPYVGILFGIMAVITGILALRHAKGNPKMGGKGRAIFGIVAGVVAGLFNGAMIVMTVFRYW